MEIRIVFGESVRAVCLSRRGMARTGRLALASEKISKKMAVPFPIIVKCFLLIKAIFFRGEVYFWAQN